MDTVQQGPAPEPRKPIGWCEFKDCGKPAYYNIDLKVDDMDADLCERHFTKLMKMLGLPLSEDDEV